MPLSKKLRFEVLKRDSFKCQYCGAEAPSALLEVDHISPQAKGGSDNIWNLITSCQPCNSGKSDRTLSDEAVITKAKRQLDQLQARRDQLEMLMEWQRSLADTDQNIADQVFAFFDSFTLGWYLNASGKENIGRLIPKYGVSTVMDAIRIAAPRYLEVADNGTHTSDSVGLFVSKIGAICEVEKRTGGDADLKALYYIRGIVRKRLEGRYYEPYRALDALMYARQNGVSLDQLTEIAKRCLCWSMFLDNVYQSVPEVE